MPLAVAYRQGVVYFVQSSGGKISYIDLEGKMVYNPEKMTESGPKGPEALRGGKKGTKKKDFSKKLSNWIDAKRLEEDESIPKTQKGTSFIRNRPTLALKVALSRLTSPNVALNRLKSP